jgi:hypothetical protein
MSGTEDFVLDLIDCALLLTGIHPDPELHFEARVPAYEE